MTEPVNNTTAVDNTATEMDSLRKQAARLAYQIRPAQLILRQK